jgi:hypothetical protein
MMKQKAGFWVAFFGVVIVGLLGCERACSDCAVPSAGLEFFPLQVGSYVEYDVQEQEFALGRAPQETRYQLKELVAEKYVNVAGQTAYRLVRFRRQTATERWQTDATLTARVATNGQAIKNENGNDFVKMLFPVYEKSTWNGNAYNALGEDQYELKQLNKPWQTFENTATVLQQNDSTLVGQDKRLEIYAANVGLVYKEEVNVQFCSASAACVGKAQIDFGRRRYVRFRKTGNE